MDNPDPTGTAETRPDVLLMADPGWPTEVAARLKEDLADLLADMSADVDWHVTVESSPLGWSRRATSP
jgi:hypothetical protein